MPNYQDSKVYKLCSYNTNEVYIGATTQPLSVRLAGHVRNWVMYNKGVSTNYLSSFCILEQGDYYIQLIEHFPCNTIEELRRKEQQTILDTKNCVNLYMNIRGSLKTFTCLEIHLEVMWA